MLYRDCPTVEVTRRVVAPPATLWALVTDIAMPARHSPELQRVEWLDSSDSVRPGARFRGHNRNAALGEWYTDCHVVEVEQGTRWVWQIGDGDEAAATWAFEIDPTSDGALVRHWGRMGPGPSGLLFAIAATPHKEGRIIAGRLREWETNMTATLDGIEAEAVAQPTAGR